jgi:DNA-binding SARP family transcriptional activator/tetratricopeptide (TPR) repeat protein
MIFAAMPRLITFGGLTIENGRLVNGVANPRSRLAILAVLAAAGERGLRRDKLLALFWPESDEERARNALRQAMFALRRDLGVGEITVGVADLRLNIEILSADVIDFDEAIRAGRYNDAVSLYRGPFLDGVFIRESPELDRWIGEQRQRLSSDFGRALEELAREATRRGDVRGAAGWWERCAAHDRYGSRTALEYMRALVAAGMREAAIQHGDVHAALVREDLDAEADADVLGFAQSLRAGAGSNGAIAASVVEPSAERSEPAPVQHANVSVSHRRATRSWIAVMTIAAVIIATAIVAIVRHGAPPPSSLIAIAPIHNRTGDSSLTELGEIAAASITQQVVQGGHASVVELPRTNDGATETGTTQSVRDARAAGASSVVHSEMYKRGDSLLVQTQIVDARDARIVHQLDPVVVPMSNAYGVVERLRERVAGAIASLADTLYQPWTRAHSRPPTYGAFQEFVQGLDAVVHQTSDEALPHFRRAAELDTTFVEAKLWLLESEDGGGGAFADSIAAAALRQRNTLAPFDQAALDRELAFRAGHWEDVYNAARRMVAGAPNTQDAQLFLAHASMATRRYSEAIAVLRGMDLDNGWLKDMPTPMRWLLQAHHLLGEHAKALEISDRARAGNFADDFRVCLRALGDYAALGRERAVDSLVAACPPSDRGWVFPDAAYMDVGQQYIVHGFPELGRRALRRALDAFVKAAPTRPRARPMIAQLQGALGDWRSAYETYRTVGDTSVFGRADLAIAAAHIGDSTTVNATIRRLEDWGKEEPQHGQDKQMLAFIATARGDRDRAILLLTQAEAEGMAPTFQGWYHRFELWPLHDDPRFEALIRPRK